MAEFDPLLIEVVKAEIEAITEEVAFAIGKTGRSHNVQLGDFACALCDASGRVIGPGHVAPIQPGVFMEVMSRVVRRDDLAPGDVLLTNDPWGGMSHLPDVAVVAPVFWQGELAAFTFAYSHHSDIGGRFAGGIDTRPASSFEEGVRLPTVKLYSAGVRNDALVATVLANVRMPDAWEGDLDAKLSGCWRAERELTRLFGKYGVDAFRSCSDFLNDRAEQALREALRSLPDGTYSHEEMFGDVDGDGRVVDGVRLAVDVRIAGDEAELDLSRCDTQSPNAINMPFGMTKGNALAALRILVGADVYLNDGFARPVTITAAPGSVVNPAPTAAVGGRAALAFRLVDVVTRALAPAAPARVPVSGEGGDAVLFEGTTADGRHFMGMDLMGSGWGGRPRADGIDGVTSMIFGALGCTPTEVLERDFPVVVDGFGFVPDTAGPGRFRGSVAVYKQLRFLEPVHTTVRTIRVTPTPGLDGGGAGAAPRNIVIGPGGSEELRPASHAHIDVPAGGAIRHHVTAAGGYGPPLERDPNLVLKDVVDGKVSVGAALDAYGVVVTADPPGVDRAATSRCRAERRQGSAAPPPERPRA